VEGVQKLGLVTGTLINIGDLVGAAEIESELALISPTASQRCNRPPGTIGTISTKLVTRMI